MARATPEALAPVQMLLRQLRDIAGVKETQPGRFVVGREEFVQFHVDPANPFAEPGDASPPVLRAEMKKAGGSGWDRYPLGDAAQQRRFVEDAKLRARRLDDDD